MYVIRTPAHWCEYLLATVDVPQLVIFFFDVMVKTMQTHTLKISISTSTPTAVPMYSNSLFVLLSLSSAFNARSTGTVRVVLTGDAVVVKTCYAHYDRYVLSMVRV